MFTNLIVHSISYKQNVIDKVLFKDKALKLDRMDKNEGSIFKDGSIKSSAKRADSKGYSRIDSLYYFPGIYFSPVRNKNNDDIYYHTSMDDEIKISNIFTDTWYGKNIKIIFDIDYIKNNFKYSYHKGIDFGSGKEISEERFFNNKWNENEMIVKTDVLKIDPKRCYLSIPAIKPLKKNKTVKDYVNHIDKLIRNKILKNPSLEKEYKVYTSEYIEKYFKDGYRIIFVRYTDYPGYLKDKYYNFLDKC